MNFKHVKDILDITNNNNSKIFAISKDNPNYRYEADKLVYHGLLSKTKNGAYITTKFGTFFYNRIWLLKLYLIYIIIYKFLSKTISWVIKLVLN